MPNYVKNRIKLSGNKETIKVFVERFTTRYEDSHGEAIDGRLIYKSGDDKYGYLNSETNEFTDCDSKKHIGVPIGYTPCINKAWSRFPDFDKVIKMPVNLNIESDSWVMPMENQFSRNTIFRDHLDEIRSFCEKNPDRKEATHKNFIKGVENYLEYGFATWYNWCVQNWGTKWNASDCEKTDTNTYEFITAWSGVASLIQQMSVDFPEVKIHYEYSSEDTGNCCGVGTFYNNSDDFRELQNQSKEAYEVAFMFDPQSRQDYKLVGDRYIYTEEDEH